ncbi:MAG: pilin [Patescibacteria group bacterium]|jgi:hypothetical protein
MTIKNKKIFIFICLFAYLLIGGLFTIHSARAYEIQFNPQISFPGFMNVGDTPKTISNITLAEFIIAFYKWSIGAIAFLAVIMIMIAGFRWMTAAGSAPQITQAKDQINSALIGLVLAIGAYSLLSFLNPALVRFKSLEIIPVENKLLTQSCDIPGGEIQLSSGAQGIAETSCKDTCGEGQYVLRDSKETGEGEGPWCCRCKGCPTGTTPLPDASKIANKNCWNYCQEQGKKGGYFSSAYPECCDCNNCPNRKTICESVKNPKNQNDCNTDKNGLSLQGCASRALPDQPGVDRFVCRFSNNQCVWKPALFCGGICIENCGPLDKNRKEIQFNRINCKAGGEACWNGAAVTCSPIYRRICTDEFNSAEEIDGICCYNESYSPSKCIYKSSGS